MIHFFKLNQKIIWGSHFGERERVRLENRGLSISVTESFKCVKKKEQILQAIQNKYPDRNKVQGKAMCMIFPSNGR
jgi:hypothetical protein